MYDLPELEDATDAWWAGVAAALRREGVADVPERLFRDERLKAYWWSGDAGKLNRRNAATSKWALRNGELARQWRSPGLLLSQCCGYQLVNGRASRLQPVGTPCYSAPGCSGPYQSSVIVVGAGNSATDLAHLKGAVAAFNSRDSHSGYNSFRGMIAPLAGGKSFFSKVVATGSHANSIAMVVDGAADVACVDCVSYALIKRHRLDALLGTRSVGFTTAAPGLPYVTSAGASAERVRRIRAGLQAAMADPALAGARDALLICDIAFLTAEDYAQIGEIEDHALRLAYPELA